VCVYKSGPQMQLFCSLKIVAPVWSGWATLLFVRARVGASVGEGQTWMCGRRVQVDQWHHLNVLLWSKHACKHDS